MTKLQRYQCLQSAFTNTITWFNTLGYSSRDVLILRVGTFNIFNTDDFIDGGTASDCEKLSFLTRTIAAPIDFCKVTEYVDNGGYNMYAYRAPYEANAATMYDNGADDWGYFIPASKESPQYVTDLITGVDSLFSDITSIESAPVYSPAVVFLGEFATAPGNPVQHNVYKNSGDGLKYVYTGSVWVKFGYLGEFASAPTNDVYTNNRYLNSGDEKTYAYNGSTWVEVNPSLSTKVRTVSPLVKSVNTEIKMQYVDTNPKSYAYPKTYDNTGIKQMYQDLPEYAITALAYIAYKTEFFAYREEATHGDVIIINLETLCNDSKTQDDPYGNPTTVYGLLGEVLNSIDTNIVIQGGTP